MGLLVLCKINIAWSELNPNISKDVQIIIILLGLFDENFFKKTDNSDTLWKNVPEDLDTDVLPNSALKCLI